MPQRGRIPIPVLEPINPAWITDLGITEEKRVNFLISYETHGAIRPACRSIRMDPHTVYRWLKEKGEDGFPTPEAKMLREAMESCEENRLVTLENEARRRAFLGSDLLMIFLLKAARPNVYRDNVKVETNQDGTPRVQQNIQVNQFGPVPLQIQSPEHLERVIEVGRKYNLIDRLFPKQETPVNQETPPVVESERSLPEDPGSEPTSAAPHAEVV